MQRINRDVLFRAAYCALSAAVAWTTIGGNPAIAAQVFNDRTAFLNTTGPLLAEGFEGLPANNALNLPSVVANDFTVTSSNNQLGIFNTDIAGSSATEGVNALVHQSGTNETTTFTFDFSIDSFGFDLLDYGDFGAGQLTLMNNAGDNVVVAVAGGGEGNVQYFGIISDFQFTTAVFTNTIGGESFGFDRLSYGTAVPEPSALVLVGILLGAVVTSGASLRRRRAV